jgi:hypothetical protein
MKVTVDFGEELSPLVQEHLDKGTVIQNQIRSAVLYYNKMKEAEAKGNTCGYGDKSRFRSYNTALSPSDMFEILD